MAAVQSVDVAATITACGTIAAIIVGARATRSRPTTPAPPPAEDEGMPPELAALIGSLRERVAALEAVVDRVERRLDGHAEDIALLRAVEVTLEEIRRQLDAFGVRPIPKPRGRGGRE